MPDGEFSQEERSVIVRVLHWLLRLFGWEPPPEPTPEPEPEPVEPQEPSPEPFAVVVWPDEFVLGDSWAVRDGYVEAVQAGDGDAVDYTIVTLPTAGAYTLTARVWAPDESDERDLIYLARVADAANTLSAVTTLADTEGLSTSPIVGPYLVGPALLGAPPRHFLILAASDTGANANVTLTVDGADRTYRTSDSSSMHPAGYVAVAMD